MSTARISALFGVVALFFFGAIGGAMFMGIASGAGTGEVVGACSDAPPTTTDPTQVGDLSESQLRNAQTIIAGGVEHGIPPRGWVVALATAMQESQLENLDYGDRDSLGLFQQRPSTGWGTPEQVTDPVLSTQAFYGVAEHTDNPGLVDIDGWQDMPITEAAQAVQASAYPDAYAQWEQLARQLVSNLQGTVEDGPSDCAPDTAWVLPVEGSYTITSRFGECGSPVRSSCHTGLDFADSGQGLPVVASAAGTVSLVEDLGDDSYGRYVVIDHADGVQTYYAHLQGFQPGIGPGQTVEAGQTLGTIGSTGNSTGPHLHFEVRQDDVPLDPEPWLTDRGVQP